MCYSESIKLKLSSNTNRDLLMRKSDLFINSASNELQISIQFFKDFFYSLDYNLIENKTNNGVE